MTSYSDSQRILQQSAQDATVRCVVCGSYLSGRTRVRLDSMRLIECQDCHSWTYLPRPTLQQQAAIHDDAGYFEHPYFQNRRNAQEENDRRCRQVFKTIGAGIDLLSLEGERLLDVGCDVGLFLQSAARQFGVAPIGIDVSSRSIQYLKSQSIEAYHSDLEHAPDAIKDLSIITAIDLIEHVVDPKAFLQQVYARLRPGGVLYLDTPNIHSFVYTVGRWLCRLTNGQPASLFDRLFPPQHIQYFTVESLAALAQECGFEVVQISNRPYRFSELGTSWPMRIGLMILQLYDRLTQNGILLCALLRKPK